MTGKFISRVEIEIQAPASRVWNGLTDPELIKQYLFGTQVTTDWKAGGPITYKGMWQGKPYEDKGKVLEVVPGKKLVSTFWSSLSGVPDAPENYQTIAYELTETDGRTRLVLTQDNNATQEDADHSTQNWKMVMEGLKKLVEA